VLSRLYLTIMALKYLLKEGLALEQILEVICLA
jgi:hypothetical protein